MPAVFATIDRLSLFAAVSLFALPVLAAEEHPMLPPDLPEVAVVVDVVSPTQAEPAQVEPDVAAPELPSVIVSVPPADPGPPELPEAKVAITQADIFPTALAGRLTAGEEIARLPHKQREALASFYAGRLDRPLWVEGSAFTPKAQSVMKRLKAADEDGLDPVNYPVPAVASPAKASADEWAAAELKLSAAAILYARDARGARIEPSRISALVTPTIELPEADAVLAALAAAPDAGAALEAFNPTHPGYRALKARLAESRASRPARPTVSVPPGRALSLGMRDPRVPLIRTRLNIGPGEGPDTYDERVATAVASFQKEKGLPANGVLTPQTQAALRGAPPAPVRTEGDLIANMERWRWLPADLGSRYVSVNIPEFRLRILDQGRPIHETKVIVGKAETPTPIFSDEMETVIVNPSWTMPPSILRKEVFPAMANDPYYAERRGYRVFRARQPGCRPAAARRAQRARLHQVHLPQPACGLPARHPEPEPLLGRASGPSATAACASSSPSAWQTRSSGTIPRGMKRSCASSSARASAISTCASGYPST